MSDPVTYILPIDGIALSSRSKDLLEQVTADHSCLTDLGSFSENIQEQIRSEFLPDRISDTLSIEDIRVDARVTRAIMEGQALAEPDKYYECEVRNAIDASDFAIEQADTKHPLSPATIREIHRRMMREVIPDAGAFRTTPNEITGARYPTADWTNLPDLMAQLCTDLDNAPNSIHPLVLAVWAHAAFAKIHPFIDGNGRTGRLVQDFILVNRSYLPVGIPMGFRSSYYAALSAADDGDLNDLVHLVGTAQIGTIEKTIRIARAPRERMARIQQLVKRSSATLKNNKYRQYELWLHRVEAIKDEFTRWIEDFNNEAEGIHIRIHPSNTISFEKWEEISKKGWARSNWVMTMTISVQSVNRYSICLFASRHNYGWANDQEHIPSGMVSIMLTGADETSGSRYDYSGYKDRFIRLRELLLIDKRLIAYRDPTAMRSEQLAKLCPSTEIGFDPLEEGRWIPESDAMISDVVEEFLVDVLDKLGLLEP